jgi:hypothetical protein
MRTSSLILATAAGVLVASSLLIPPAQPVVSPAERKLKPAIVADASVVIAAYEEWRADFLAGPHVVEIGLTRAAGHVDRRQGLRGTFTFDLDDASAVVRIEDACEELDLWLVANVDGPRRSFMPEPGDECRHLGSLYANGNGMELEVDLSGPEWKDVALDTVAITRAGVRPEVNTLLVGQPSAFERLYGRELIEAQREQVVRAGTGLPLALITLQFPIGSFHPSVFLQTMVDQGEDLFFVQTFSGNGRTCGTCHPAENNFTLDKDFIATMNPSDPLFIAEFDPNFDPLQNGGLMFEQPQLMHDFGLILENLDGFDDLANRFVMRSVSHTFAQRAQRIRPPIGQSPPKHRTGWGGDGAPGDGTLRDFATGAVTQHFPITLNRVPNVDFVLPTSTELDALEIFQLALGRQEEFDLQNPGSPGFIAFEDSSAETGKGLFSSFACDFCHLNAGSNSFATTVNGQIVGNGGSNPANGNFDTGVERFLTGHPDGTGLPRPIDGGFGTQPQGMPQPGGIQQPIPNSDGSFGDQTFNTPSVVEFADTVPGFHNHITASTPLDPDPVMATVAFYATPEFANSSSGVIFGGIMQGLGPGEIKRISIFLRAINAVQNDRNARRFLKQAHTLAITNFIALEPVIMRGVQLADAEVEDAEQQCAAAGLFPDPIPNLQSARSFILDVQNTGLPIPDRITAILKAHQRLVAAEDDLVQ